MHYRSNPYKIKDQLASLDKSLRFVNCDFNEQLPVFEKATLIVPTFKSCQRISNNTNFTIVINYVQFVEYSLPKTGCYSMLVLLIYWLYMLVKPNRTIQ